MGVQTRIQEAKPRNRLAVSRIDSSEWVRRCRAGCLVLAALARSERNGQGSAPLMASEYLRVAKARVEQTRVTGKTRHYRDGKQQRPPQSLEIVQLPPDTGYYLLYLDENGIEVNDTWHESLDRAMDQANCEFGLSAEEWERVTVT